MSINDKQLDHLSKLARVELPEKQRPKLKKQLSEILDYFKKLEKLDTEKNEPTSQTTGIVNATRKDEVTESLSTKEVLKNAPDTDDGFFKVKSVFK